MPSTTLSKDNILRDIKLYNDNYLSQPPSEHYTGIVSYTFQMNNRGLFILHKHYEKGKLHRMDGPAVYCMEGVKLFFIKGKQLSKDEYYNQLGVEFERPETLKSDLA